MTTMFDKRHYPAYAWFLASLLVCISLGTASLWLIAQRSAILSRNHTITTPSLAPSTAPTSSVDYIAQANDQILARSYSRWSSATTSLMQSVPFACLLMGCLASTRTSGRRFPWSIWLLLAVQIAGAASNITGELLVDRVSDRMDVVEANVRLKTASQAELDELDNVLASLRQTNREVSYLYLFGMAACMPVVFLQAIVELRRHRSQPPLVAPQPQM